MAIPTGRDPRRSRAPDLSALDRELLALHATIDFRTYALAAERLIRKAMPCLAVGVGMLPVEWKPMFFYHSSTGFRDPLSETRYDDKINHLIPFLKENRGMKMTLPRDVLPPGVSIEQTPFYTEVMQPEGWRYPVALNFWRGTRLLGWLGPVRTAAHGDYTPAELSLLRKLHPHFETGIRRVLTIYRQSLVRDDLPQVLAHLPAATLLLDWEMRTTSCSRAASESCARWNFGPEARALNARQVFRLPCEALEACRLLRSEWEEKLRALPSGALAPAPAPRELRHPAEPGLRITVRLLIPPARGGGLPRFLIVCSHDEPTLPCPALVDLTTLSTREREIARLVYTGQTNEAVALQSGRTIGTIKKQLTAIYRKLQVRSRAELIHAMR